MTDRIIKTAACPARAADTGARGRQPLRFLVAGGLATAVHWGVMWLLVVAGQAPFHATAAGGLAGGVVNYGLQRRLTFDYRGSHTGVMPRYLLSCAAAWLVNLLVFQLLHVPAGLPTGIAQFATTALVSLMNYLVYRRLVFHD